MARTTPVSNGWMILVRPLGTIFPVAEATMSIVPHHDQTNATQNSTTIVATIARPIGDGGVSTISSAAGRKANLSRLSLMRRNGTTISVRLLGSEPLADFINSSPQPGHCRITPAGFGQRVLGSIVDQPAVIERDTPVRRPHRREPVRDDQDRAPPGDLLHVLLDDALAFIVQRTSCLVEDQD